MISNPTRLIAHTLAIVIVLLVSSVRVAPRASATDKASAKAKNRLIAHEWGTFTSIAGKDGAAVKWRPLNGSSDLPDFVYSIDGLAEGTGLRHGLSCFKCNMEALIRMETPVLYFYADRETTISVRVDFPRGSITEWYPQARGVYMGDGFHDGTIDWGRVTVMPGAQEAFPVESSANHYYAARETDAATVRVCSEKEKQHERFLFYRGVGSFDLPVAAKLEGDKLTVMNTGRENISQFILFENRDGKIGYRIHDLSGGKVEVERPALDQTIDWLARDLEAELVAGGLYEKEAKAMIKTWRDSWFEEGMRLFYIVPRKATDRILPLTIEPAPAELTRVLVGRMEIITPETERAVQQQVAQLGDSSPRIQSVAATIIRKHGRFSEPLLKSILEKTTDAKLRLRIEQVIKTASVATN